MITGVWLTGRSASDGFLGALLAGTDWTGPMEPLEGRRGLFSLLADAADVDIVVRGLGEEWIVAGLPLMDVPSPWICRLLEDATPSTANSRGLVATLRSEVPDR